MRRSELFLLRTVSIRHSGLHRLCCTQPAIMAIIFKAAVLLLAALTTAAHAPENLDGILSQQAITHGSQLLKLEKDATDTAAHQSITLQEPMSLRSRGLLGINAKSLVSKKGIDVRGSTKPYGNCKGVHPAMSDSHWCQTGVPGNPTNSKLKYGRQTIYGPGGKGWCGKSLEGSDWAVPVAISTKYLPMDGVSPNSQYCGQCMCIRTRGTDVNSNPNPPPEAESSYGKVFKGIVQDMCPECCADCIDVLAANPYFSAVPKSVAYSVGVWTVEWNFVKCDTDCNKFFKGK